MLIKERLQFLIHAMEVGRLSRWVQLLPLAAAVVALAVVYDLTNYRGFSSPEAMDAAQVARNLAEGRGYSTDFIRPFSIYLVQKHNLAIHQGEAQWTNTADLAQLNTAHPDLANAPVYPTLLAGLIKLGQPEWKVETRKPFWSTGGKFQRYKPEFYIAIFNQVLLLAVVALTFLIAMKLFDAQVAWLAALLTLGAEMLWHFSISGQSTLLLLVLFLGLVWNLARLEELGHVETPDMKRLFALALLAGALTGAGMLTRYAFGWMVLPVIIFIAVYGGPRRAGLLVATLLTFALTVTPWILRNLSVSGTWLGTAGYAVMEGSSIFPGSKLMQSTNPDLTDYYFFWARNIGRKLIDNARIILQGDLLRLAGGWILVLFLAGLLLGLRNMTARRLRYFTLMCLGVLLAIQAMGRTELSTHSADINSENLLVLLIPLVAIFGVAFFLTLLNQMNTPSLGARLAVTGLLVVVACQPLIAALLPPWPSPMAWPDYNPPEIQKISGYMKPDELMMSDTPWAVAWYGRRQCAWTTVNCAYEFYQLNDFHKKISAIYLTVSTLNNKLLSDCYLGPSDSWGNFALKTLALGKPPQRFPLFYAPPPGTLAVAIFLTDRDRWQNQ